MDFLGPMRATPLPALLFLAFLPMWPFVQRHHARLFFTTLSILMIVIVAGPTLASGLLAIILLAYFPIEWAARLTRGRRTALLGGWLALHIAAYLCMFLPLPAVFRNERVLRPADAQWMFVMISGIGLTFMRLVSLLYDRVTGRAKRMSYADYLCYMVYFPQFRCVPVERSRKFVPKLTRARENWKPIDVLAGCARIALGIAALAALPKFAKLMPDIFGALNPRSPANPFAHPELLSTGQIILLVHAIPVAIYGLVSGAASIQLGVSRTFGIRGSENTHFPFLASSPQTLWWRWNITVFAWLRDYAYAPLGGGKRHKYLNILLVFVYCGLLHAIHWRGVVWGLWTGGVVAAYTWAEDRWQARRRAQLQAHPSALKPGLEPPVAADSHPVRFLTALARLLGRLLTLEWATVGTVMLVDSEYCGARLLHEYGARLAALFT